ncbi:MAG TPA: pyridoxamine 5'-phosphate oxidase family protein [Thermoleophilaceae bacterium]|jgi:PPOX class probable F420-dependent enzyme
MSDDELQAFVAEQMIVSVATTGPRGRPHLVPLWYAADGIVLRSWTYAKSQKAKNLERDPRATLQIEDGVLYHELRGVMLECDVELEHEPAEVEKYGLALFERYAELNPDVEAMVRQQAQKRVGLTFRPTRIVSWDHTKLGGTY